MSDTSAHCILLRNTFQTHGCFILRQGIQEHLPPVEKSNKREPLTFSNLILYIAFMSHIKLVLNLS